MNELSKKDLLIRQSLLQMAENGASDCIVLSGLRPFYKVNGEMVADKSLRKVEDRDFEAFFAQGGLTTSMFQNVRSGKEQIDLGYTIDNRRENVKMRYRFNFSAFNGRQSRMRLVARALPLQPPMPDEINVPPEIVEETMAAPYGVGVVGGATGSGKSTTLSALIRNIASQKPKHISTLEAPIEYVYDYVDTMVPVVQVEVGGNIESFSRGVEAAMRQAPDYLLIGETRDMATADGVLQFAETGHYALTTIHISTAAALFDRFSVFFSPEHRDGIIKKLISQLSFILVQSLLPKSGGGRVAVREYLVLDNQMKLELLGCSDTHDIRIKIGQWLNERETSFRHDADRLLEEGLIEPEIRSKFLYVIGDKGGK